MNKEIETITQAERDMLKIGNLNSLAIPQVKEKISGSSVQLQENAFGAPIIPDLGPIIIEEQQPVISEPQVEPQVPSALETPFVINEPTVPTIEPQTVEQPIVEQPVIEQPMVEQPIVETANIDIEEKWQKEVDEIFNNLTQVINEARDIAIMGMENIYRGMLTEAKEREAENKAKEQLNIQSQEMIKNNAAQVGLNPVSLENQNSQNAPITDIPIFQIPPVENNRNLTM